MVVSTALELCPWLRLGQSRLLAGGTGQWSLRGGWQVSPQDPGPPGGPLGDQARDRPRTLESQDVLPAHRPFPLCGFKHGSASEQSDQGGPTWPLFCGSCSELQREATWKAGSRGPSGDACPQPPPPHTHPTRAPQRLLLFDGPSYFQIFPHVFQNTEVTTPCICRVLYSFSKPLPANTSSHLILPISQAGMELSWRGPQILCR